MEIFKDREKFKEIKKREYEAQFFGSDSKEISQEITQIYLDAAKDGFDVFNQYLCQHKAKSNANKVSSTTESEAITQLTDGLTRKFLADMNAPLKNLEEYNQSNIFNIPDHIILSEDEPNYNDPRCKRTEELNLDKNIIDLQNRFKALRYLEATLLEEIAATDNIFSGYEKKLETLETLAKTLKNLPQVPGNKVAKLVKDAKELEAVATSVLELQDTKVEREWDDDST